MTQLRLVGYAILAIALTIGGLTLFQAINAAADSIACGLECVQ